MAPTVRLLAAAAALAAALAQSPSPPPGAPACASSPPTAVRVASASDGALVLSWGPPAGGTPATAFLVTLTPVPGGTPAPPFNRPEWGVCAAPRALARLLGGDARGAAFRALVTGTAYTAVVTAQFACGALDAPAPGVSATIAPASLPTPDAPTFWLDAESFPRLPAATLLGGAPIADVTGSWFMRTWKSNAGTPPTTVKLSPRAGGRYARGLVFTGNAYDVLVPNTTAGAGTGATAIASAADNAAFGFRTDADNTLTVFAAWQGGGGFVVSKGGYPYFGDAGWNLDDYGNYMGMNIMFTPGDANKFPSTFPRVAQAINYTDANYQPGIAGALASYSLYRPTANNCTYTLDACLGVTTGAASDICNNPAPGVNPTLDVWYPHAVEDRDTYQYVSPATGTVSNTASWAPCGTGVTRLMTNAARQWALTVGGGHFWGGTSGTTANGAGSLPLYPLTGSIYSIAVYRRALSAAERSAVQAFLSARYELACAALAPPGVVGSAANLTYSNGGWYGSAPVCVPPPAAVGGGAAVCSAAGATVAGATACARVLFAEAFGAPAAAPGVAARAPSLADALAGGAPAPAPGGAPAPLPGGLAPAWEALPELPPSLAAAYWSRAAPGVLLASLPATDDACSYNDTAALVVNRPAAALGGGAVAWPASLGPGATLSVAGTLALDPSAAGGLVGAVVFPTVLAAFPGTANSYTNLVSAVVARPVPAWGTPLAFPATVASNHAFVRLLLVAPTPTLSAVGAAGAPGAARLEVVLNSGAAGGGADAVDFSVPWPGAAPPVFAPVRVALELTSALPADVAAPAATYTCPAARAGVQCGGASFFVTARALAGFPAPAPAPVALAVVGWAVPVGSAGVAAAGGRAAFSDFAVSMPGSCGPLAGDATLAPPAGGGAGGGAACAALAPGQACAYECPGAPPVVASCAPGAPAGAAAAALAFASAGAPLPAGAPPACAAPQPLAFPMAVAPAPAAGGAPFPLPYPPAAALAVPPVLAAINAAWAARLGVPRAAVVVAAASDLAGGAVNLTAGAPGNAPARRARRAQAAPAAAPAPGTVTFTVVVNVGATGWAPPLMLAAANLVVSTTADAAAYAGLFAPVAAALAAAAGAGRAYAPAGAIPARAVTTPPALGGTTLDVANGGGAPGGGGAGTGGGAAAAGGAADSAAGAIAAASWARSPPSRSPRRSSRATRAPTRAAAGA